MADGSYLHYVANGLMVGHYQRTEDIDSAHMLPPTLRLKIRPGDKVEYLERDEAGAWVVVTTWDVITELVERAK